jgi:hypothetical protein
VDVIGPCATLEEVNWVGVTSPPILVVRDSACETVARPYLPAVGQPPEGEADWNMVYGA